MFTNPGKKIKTYSKVVFWVMEVFAILAAIAVIIQASGNGQTFAGILAAILVFALFTFLAWISAIYMVAYGEMIEDIQKVADETKKQNEILQAQLQEIAKNISSK